jgi:adenine-specific DNA-methyltransferase
VFRKTSGQASKFVAGIYDHILWYARNREKAKWRPLYQRLGEDISDASYNAVELPDFSWRRIKSDEELPPESRRFRTANLTSQGASEIGSQPFSHEGKTYAPSAANHWKPSRNGMVNLAKAARLLGVGNTLTYKRYIDDFPIVSINNIWLDTLESTFSVQ